MLKHRTRIARIFFVGRKVKRLLDSFSRMVWMRMPWDVKGRTSLHQASESGLVGAALVLLEHGVV